MFHRSSIHVQRIPHAHVGRIAEERMHENKEIVEYFATKQGNDKYPLFSMQIIWKTYMLGWSRRKALAQIYPTFFTGYCNDQDRKAVDPRYVFKLETKFK